MKNGPGVLQPGRLALLIGDKKEPPQEWVSVVMRLDELMSAPVVEQRFCKPPEFPSSRSFFGRKSSHFIKFCEPAGSGGHSSCGIWPSPPQKLEQLFMIGWRWSFILKVAVPGGLKRHGGDRFTARSFLASSWRPRRCTVPHLQRSPACLQRALPAIATDHPANAGERGPRLGEL
jgi:hypothetical protein